MAGAKNAKVMLWGFVEVQRKACVNADKSKVGRRDCSVKSMWMGNDCSTCQTCVLWINQVQMFSSAIGIGG